MSLFGCCTILTFGSLGGLIVALILFALWHHVKKQSRDLEQFHMTLLQRLEGTYSKESLSHHSLLTKHDSEEGKNAQP
jgi:hypothetical protein